MTVSKKTLLELEEEELMADLQDGFITREEFNRRMRELQQDYRRPKKDRDDDY